MIVGGAGVDAPLAEGVSIDVILRSCGSVRTRLFSGGFVEPENGFWVDAERLISLLDIPDTGTFALGKRDWVVNVRLVST